MRVFPISAFNDNYIWVILHSISSQAVVVDPGDAKPVLQILSEKNIELQAILLTHHHWDHTGGVEDLLAVKHVPVYGPKSIKLVSHPVKEGERFTVEAIERSFEVLEIPGHTLDHIAYVTDEAVFCGDTLFTGGCGRVFEGTFTQMYASLQKLAALPSSTAVYCAHEYTEANLNFAKIVEPTNKDLLERLAKTKLLRSEGNPTVPGLMAEELKTNPFLRCHETSIRMAASNHSNRTLVDPIDIFTEIRSWKDSF